MNHTGNGAAGAQTLRLDMLPKGQTATVAALHPGPEDRAMALRLMEIGFLPGETVRVIAHGFPAADPLAVRVGQATFALRRHEAAMIQVNVDAAEEVVA
jgi:ferrous iron transport protein A